MMADRINYWTKGVRRRSVLRGGVIGTLGLAGAALVGCGSKDDGAGTDTGASGAVATVGPGGATVSGAAKRGGKITIITSADTGTLDPAKTFVTTSAAVWGLSYNRLVTAKHGGNASPVVNDPQPDLAESWEISPDGLSYVFKIRKGVKFHNIAPVNGRELNAEDVKYSHERNGTMKGAANASVWEGVTKYEVIDANTFKITRGTPSADFFYQMASQYAVVYPKEAESVLDTKVIGTGPFMLKEWRKNSGFSFQANPDYYIKGEDGKALPYLDGFELAVVPDPAAVIAGLRSGSIDLGSGLTDDEMDSLKNASSVKLRKDPPSYETNQHFAANLTKDPWKDVRVRRALSLAMDRDAMGAAYFGAKENFIYTGQIPFAFLQEKPYTQEQLGKWAKKDLAEAKKLLDAAGVSSLKTDMRFSTSYKWPVDYSQIAAADLGKIGVTAGLNAMDYDAFWNLYRTTGDYNTVMSMMGSGQVVDHYVTSFAKAGASRNYPRIKDAKVDELAQKQRVAVDPKARKEILKEFFDYMQDQVYYTWLNAPSATNVAMNPKIQNYTGLTLGTHLYLTYQYAPVWLSA